MHTLTRRTLIKSGLMAMLAASALSPVWGQSKPTVVLVHGAFAESASWDGVANRLLAKGYRVVAVANPLRGVGSDAR